MGVPNPLTPLRLHHPLIKPPRQPGHLFLHGPHLIAPGPLRQQAALDFAQPLHLLLRRIAGRNQAHLRIFSRQLRRQRHLAIGAHALDLCFQRLQAAHRRVKALLLARRAIGIAVKAP